MEDDQAAQAAGLKRAGSTSQQQHDNDDNDDVGAHRSAKEARLDEQSLQEATHHQLDLEAVKQELTCNICLDVATRPTTVLPCVHHFCWTCLRGWYKTNRCKCPRCSAVTTSARVNPVLNNLCELVRQADPSSAKPDEMLDEEQQQMAIYRTAHNGDLTLWPSSARTYGAGLNEDDEGDDDDVEGAFDANLNFWPCPCCVPGNRSGVLCQHPIPDPDLVDANPERRRPRPERGDDWPEIEDARDFISPQSAHEHGECTSCTRWIPSAQCGVPEAVCSGCRNLDCSPYDDNGGCVIRETQWSSIEESIGTLTTIDAAVGGTATQDTLRHLGRLNANECIGGLENERLTDYCQHNSIKVSTILCAMLDRAKALSDLDAPTPHTAADTEQGDAVAPEAATDAATHADVGGNALVNDATGDGAEQGQPVGPGAAVTHGSDRDKRRREITSVKDDASALVSWARPTGQLNTSAARAIVGGHWCQECARKVVEKMILWWWEEVVANREHDAAMATELRKMPFCWYGRECRTQHRSQEHAAKYWHLGPLTGRPADYTEAEGAQAQDGAPVDSTADPESTRDDGVVGAAAVADNGGAHT
ncbi:unnamed protein product [Parajaminaea phylloscopi]